MLPRDGYADDARSNNYSFVLHGTGRNDYPTMQVERRTRQPNDYR